MGSVKKSKTARTGAHAAARAAAEPGVSCAILTVSDTRRGADDTSGAAMQSLLEKAGHVVAARAWVADERRAIRAAARKLLTRRGVRVVLVTGGTGMSPRDVTPEALEPLYERALPGFGEAFRARSWAQVGAAAWFSRASAGIAKGRLLVLLPGSRAAVTLALSELLIPELHHVVRMLGASAVTTHVSTRSTR
jgi:molybdenum cofactor biosynthesis protein B